jgi:diguanylate cyclase (GGDEF)-like protein
MLEPNLDAFAHLWETTPVLVAVYDAQDVLRYANLAFRDAFGIEHDEAPSWSDIVRRNFQQGRGTRISSSDIEQWISFTQARRGKIPFRAFETDMLWMTETVSTGGSMLCIASDVTGLLSEERELRQDRDLAIRSAQMDELTGAASRGFLTARVADMVAGGGMAGAPGCVAILDVDRFKAINDSYGHQAGDVVLRSFTQSVQERVRRNDCLGRIGGDEFALALPNTNRAEAVMIVQHILQAVQASRPLASDFSYSFSAGVAEVRSGDAPGDIFSRADTALYQAKKSGRARLDSDCPLSPISDVS